MELFDVFAGDFASEVVLVFNCMRALLGSVDNPGENGFHRNSEETVQFLFTFGALPVAVVLLVGRKFKLEKSPKGILYGLGNGVLAGVGNAALAAAYRAGGNTSVITAATAMYPMITVLLAVTILRERLTRLHKIGLVFAAIAFIIFSL